MDFGTLVAECTAESGQSTASSAQTTYIKQAIIEAMNFNSRFGPFTWQEKVTTRVLTSGDTYCSLPNDFGRFVGELWYVKGSDTTQRRRVKIVGLDEEKKSIALLNDEWTDSLPSAYRIAALDFVRGRLEFSPDAEDDGDYFEFRYKGLGKAPIAQYVSNAWTYLDPYTRGIIDDNWTNEWLQEGRYLTKCRALYYLWSRWNGGTDAAQAKASMYLQQWTEELAKLQGENAHKKRLSGTKKSW